MTRNAETGSLASFVPSLPGCGLLVGTVIESNKCQTDEDAANFFGTFQRFLHLFWLEPGIELIQFFTNMRHYFSLLSQNNIVVRMRPPRVIDLAHPESL